MGGSLCKAQEALDAEESCSEVEVWPLKDAQNHNLFKLHTVRIFGEAETCWHGLVSAKLAGEKQQLTAQWAPERRRQHQHSQLCSSDTL